MIGAIAEINAFAGYQTVLEAVLHALVRELGYKAALVRRLDAERRILTLAAAVGLSETYLAKGVINIDKSALDREALAGKVVAVEDVRRDPRFQYGPAAAEEGIGSAIVAPLALPEEVLGVLRVYTAEPRIAGPDELHFFQALSTLTARALITAHRYEALKNLAHRISCSLDLQDVLTTMLRASVSELNYKGGIIRLLDARGDRLVLVAATGLSQCYLSKGEVAVEQSALDREVLAGRPVTVYDIASHPGLQYPDEALREGIRSGQSVPLSVPDRLSGKVRVIGVLRVYSSQPHRFTVDEISFLQIIAGLGAIAIHNAQLHDTLSQSVRMLQPDEEGWLPVD